MQYSSCFQNTYSALEKQHTFPTLSPQCRKPFLRRYLQTFRMYGQWQGRYQRKACLPPVGPSCLGHTVYCSRNMGHIQSHNLPLPGRKKENWSLQTRKCSMQKTKCKHTTCYLHQSVALIGVHTAELSQVLLSTHKPLLFGSRIHQSYA